MASRKITYATLSVFVFGFFSMCYGSIPPKQYVVGGEDGWGFVIPMQSWADQFTFYVGDLLEFNYSEEQEGDDVLVTDKEGYDTCSWTKVSTELPNTGHNNVTVPFGMSYYITADPDHCKIGQKMAINGKQRPPSQSRKLIGVY